METLTDVRKLTVAGFHQMEFADDDPYLYELLDGELVKKRAPAPRHQLILASLFYQVSTFDRQQPQPGQLLFAPVDVFLDDYSAPQPDLVYVGSDRLDLITKDGIMGPPTMVAEISSPSSVRYDRFIKRNLYERFGIPEYWLIDPTDSYIEIHTLQNGRYELLSAASPTEGSLNSNVLPGLVLDLAVLFAE